MQRVENRVRFMMKSNQIDLNVYVGKIIIETTANILINYAAVVYLNLSIDTNELENQYIRNIKPLNNKIWNASDLCRLNFNGFDTFQTRKVKLNAKAFTKFLKNHDNHGLYDNNGMIHYH